MVVKPKQYLEIESLFELCYVLHETSSEISKAFDYLIWEVDSGYNHIYTNNSTTPSPGVKVPTSSSYFFSKEFLQNSPFMIMYTDEQQQQQ